MEFRRRLKEELGLALEIINKGDVYAKIKDGKKEMGQVLNDGTLQGYSEYLPVLSKIGELAKDITEYYNAFYKAFEKGNIISTSGELAYYKLLEIGDTVLAGKCNPINGEFSFVTWQLDNDSNLIWGNYFNSYDNAKKDFAERSGLIDKATQFTETEMKVIRQGLTQLVNSGDISFEQNTLYGGIIEKIEDIVPAITNNEEKEHAGLIENDELEL